MVWQWLVLLVVWASTGTVATATGSSLDGFDLFSLNPFKPQSYQKRTLQDDAAMECNDALYLADENFDRKVDKTEYIRYLELYGPTNFLPTGVQKFEDLPLILRSNFLILACLCLQSDDATNSCCVGDNAHISNFGTAPDDNPTSDEIRYLFQVCYLSETSIARYVESMAPSPIPTPQLTLFPTMAPTEAPTRKPVTEKPTGVPTRRPTSAPTKMPVTSEPSSSPVEEPSAKPTVRPTPLPSPIPTVRPTPSPSSTPTVKPTLNPSSSPSGATPRPSAVSPPTQIPTEQTSLPSGTPTLSSSSFSPSSFSASSVPTPNPTNTITVPSSSPSDSKTVLPTITKAPSVPSTDPTSSPSEVPTSSPSDSFVQDVVARTTYVIGVKGDAVSESYEGDLIAAMDILASTIASTMDLTTSQRRRHLIRNRRLEVVTDLPTSLDGVIATVCPDSVPIDDRCEDVSASIYMILTEGENVTEVQSVFEHDLELAIQNGELQDALTAVNPDSPVYIVTSFDSGEDDETINGAIGGDGLSSGAISGIVIGGMAGLVVFAALLSRRRRSPDADEYYLKQEESVDIEEIGDTPSSRLAVSAAAGGAVSAAALGGKHKEPKRADLAPGVVPTSPDKQDSDAGSSGWSSREGLSSLESSVDEETRASSVGGGASSLGATQALAQSSSRGSDPGLQMTYSELDQAIQNGDWAAVGVTAALLASQSYDTAQSEDAGKKVNFRGSLNPVRAAELDALVEAGDWAGVVAAAAKYDSQETRGEHQGSVSSQRSDKDSSKVSSVASSGGSVGSSGSGTGTALTGGSGAFTSNGTTASDSNARVKKLDEIRAEVEQLVERVVPEEKDNIEEMLLQFRGREEELVETLRSMQEREVAQKARLEGQKRAKRDARQAVETKNAEQSTPLTGSNIETPGDESWMREIDATPAETPAAASAAAPSPAESSGLLGIRELEPPREKEEDEEVKVMQRNLKEAIDAEDWEKVAEAAAGLSGRYVAEHGDSDTVSNESTNDTDRSQELQSLVEKGDWDGVVAAASKYNEADRSVSTGDSTKEERRVRRKKRLQEEQDALEQANIWSAIAEQTKNEAVETASDTNRAATVAADWAIARSLSELQAAERAGQLMESDSGESDATNSDEKESEGAGGEEGTI